VSKTEVIVKRPSVSPSNMLMGMTQRVAPRIGEGQPVQLHRITKTSDNKTVSFGADFSTAPVPTRRYAADVCDIKVHRNDVIMVFGQESGFEGDLDSVLQLRMNPTCVKDFVESLKVMGASTFGENIDNLNTGAEPLTEIKVKPVRFAKAQVSYVSVAMSGFDTCMDFYSASPFAMVHMQNSGQLFVEPIARVDIHTALFVSFVAKLREVVKDLPQLKEESK
jgi:hypothetical protein